MKILIVRFSSIGDIVLTTPVIRGCAEQIPNAEVHFLTKKAYATILSNNPYIQRIWTLENSFSKLVVELKAFHFDVIIDLHNNLRTRRLSFSLGIQCLRFNKLNFKKWLYVKKIISHLPDVHIVDRYLESVASLGVKNDQKGLDFHLPNLLEPIQNINLNQAFVCVAIGGQHNTKKLPEQKLIELCRLINKPIVLIGGKEDAEVGNSIEQKVLNVTSLCGKININQSALVMEKATVVFTHDTGMMHIASALKKNIISIWGNTVPEFGMYPYLPGELSQSFEVDGLSCRPCSKIGFSSCPKGHFKCMMNQDVEKIAGSINLLFLGKN